MTITPVHLGANAMLTPSSAPNITMSTVSQDQSLNFTMRSKSIANNVIHRLKRRVSFVATREGNSSKNTFIG